MISRVCACGNEFETTQKRIDEGRGRYCSKPCMYRFRVRPSGLTYRIVAENQAWFPKGHERNLRGDSHPDWGGDNVGYAWMHKWVRKNKVKPETCEHCGEAKPLEWANKSHEYKRELDDWLALCRLCHRRYDAGSRGAAVAKFGVLR